MKKNLFFIVTLVGFFVLSSAQAATLIFDDVVSLFSVTQLSEAIFPILALVFAPMLALMVKLYQAVSSSKNKLQGQSS